MHLFRKPGPFFQSQQAGSMSHKLVGLELTCEADDVALPDPVLRELQTESDRQKDPYLHTCFCLTWFTLDT